MLVPCQEQGQQRQHRRFLGWQGDSCQLRAFLQALIRTAAGWAYEVEEGEVLGLGQYMCVGYQLMSMFLLLILLYSQTGLWPAAG